MKTKVALFTVVALLLVIAALPVYAEKKDDGGNLAPSGAHYNLNIIGVKDEHPKSANLGCGSGHRIFVDLGTTGAASRTKINLGNSTPLGGGFWVEDCNGTDGTASFWLPEPDPDDDGTTAYSVFARALGKPGGKADMVTCGTDDKGDEYCWIQILHVEAHGNNNKFRNVSKYLLYAYIPYLCTDWDEVNQVCNTSKTNVRVPLFSDDLEDYLWYYDNKGLKILQLRFYPGVFTTVPAYPGN